MKDDMECDCMNEEFGKMPRYHWYPVAIYDTDGKKIRDLTKEEQIAWIKKQMGGCR